MNTKTTLPGVDIDGTIKSFNLTIQDIQDIQDKTLTVRVTVSGLDRTDVYGIQLHNTANGRALAARLHAAIAAGKALTDLKVQKDIGGRTYLGSYARFLGRQLNANLKAMGF